jgi:hypothetical protein
MEKPILVWNVFKAATVTKVGKDKIMKFGICSYPGLL